MNDFDTEMRHMKEFKRIFGIPMNNFFRPTARNVRFFDLNLFDTWLLYDEAYARLSEILGPQAELSTEELVRMRFGNEAVELIYSIFDWEP